MRSVAHIDNTARPQMVGEENKHFREMLSKVRKMDGHGVVLNTSFNIHGMPIARTPGGRARHDEEDQDEAHVPRRFLC